MSAVGQRNIVDQATYGQLPDSCKLLVDLINLMPVGNDMMQVRLDEELFPGSPATEVYVTAEDIADFMRMRWLNAPILEVFQMHLFRICNIHDIPFGFISPSQIAPTLIKTQLRETSNYIGNAMVRLKDKKYILAPYHQNEHWLLLVIEPLANTVYIMDSKAEARILDVSSLINVAFRVMWSNMGTRRSSVEWKSIPCTQQPGGDECGYCVMKNMSDIVIRFGQGYDIHTVDVEEYSQAKIDMVRELWVEFFRSVMH